MKLENSFKYHEGIDYDTTEGNHPCSCGDDYCRCSTITNIQVSVDFPKFVRGLIKKLEVKSEIQEYGIDRLATTHKLYEGSLFSGEVVGGYYGEEVGSITLEAEDFSHFTEALEKFLALEDVREQVEFLLAAEYSFLPSTFTFRDWVAVRSDPKLITVKNPMHFKKSANADFYKGYPYFVCICDKRGDTLGIIDGHHRLAANIDKDTIPVLIAV